MRVGSNLREHLVDPAHEQLERDARLLECTRSIAAPPGESRIVEQSGFRSGKRRALHRGLPGKALDGDLRAGKAKAQLAQVQGTTHDRPSAHESPVRSKHENENLIQAIDGSCSLRQLHLDRLALCTNLAESATQCAAIFLFQPNRSGRHEPASTL